MASLPIDLHFVLFPLMTQGHMIPMIDIARLLAQRGATVTIITTPINANRFKSVITRAINDKLKIQVLEFPLQLTEVGLPEGCESFDILPSAALYHQLFQAADLLEEPVDNKLRQLTPTPSCIISDNLFPWTNDIARRLDIPRLIFHGPGCFTFLCIHILMNTNILNEMVPDSEYFVLPGISDRIEITKAQGLSWGNTGKEQMAKFFERVRIAEEAANGIVVNSFQEIERHYVEEFAKAKDKTVWCIGPVSLCNKSYHDLAERGSKSGINEHDCLKWLDSRDEGSVIFVCLGSISRTCTEQSIELALGLESSNIPFIWCVRHETEELEKWFLEEGYEERVKDRGLVFRGWAPQVLILSHGAVGGFLTHCGWNSTLEGVSAGVPMVTWPHFADQFLNENFFKVCETTAALKMLSRESERRDKEKAEKAEDQDGRWHEVNRRRKSKAVTSFYVSNLHADITVPMIRNAVKNLGKLVDVYIPGRKDRTGSFFAFVRFEGVSDSGSLVNTMNGIQCGSCILQTNVAKYEKRKLATGPTKPVNRTGPTKPVNRPPPPRQPQPIPHFGGTKTGTSFAAAVSGTNNCNYNPPLTFRTPQPPPPTPIPAVQLKAVETMISCNNYCLTGEIVDIQLLDDLHVLIHADEHISASTYYAGGLKVILKFTNPTTADSYLKQEHKWNRWFSSLKLGFTEEPNQDRLARVKITGIPVHLRSDENFSAIAGNVGKVISADGHNWHAMDLSVGYATILTRSLKGINTEIKCVFNGKSYTTGIIEIENTWEPFMGRCSPESPPSVVHARASSDEEEDEDLDDDLEGSIPETMDFPAMQEDDLEEGEIEADTVTGCNQHPSDGPAVKRTGVLENNNSLYADDAYNNTRMDTEYANAGGFIPESRVEDSNDCGFIPESRVEQMDDSESETVQLDRVPACNPKTPVRPRSTNNTDNVGPLGEYGDSYIKRRRLERPDHQLSNQISTRRLIYDLDPPSDSVPPAIPIDLNVAIPCASRSGDSCASSSGPVDQAKEISSTINLGNSLGFQIRQTDIPMVEKILELGTKAAAEETGSQ